MYTMKTLKTPILLMQAIMLLILAGCALSPQTVAIKPFVDARSQPIGRDRALALDVVDRRPQQAFGNRGGVYATALISPRTDVAQSVRQALAERLQASGFRIAPAGSEAPLALRVDIEKIDYIAHPDQLVGGGLVNEVRIQAAISALARNGGQTLSGQYQANSARRQLGHPKEVDNELFINEVVGETLRQLLHDPKIMGFLQR